MAGLSWALLFSSSPELTHCPSRFVNLRNSLLTSPLLCPLGLRFLASAPHVCLCISSNPPSTLGFFTHPQQTHQTVPQKQEALFALFPISDPSEALPGPV